MVFIYNFAINMLKLLIISSDNQPLISGKYFAEHSFYRNLANKKQPLAPIEASISLKMQGGCYLHLANNFFESAMDQN